MCAFPSENYSRWRSSWSHATKNSSSMDQLLEEHAYDEEYINILVAAEKRYRSSFEGILRSYMEKLTQVFCVIAVRFVFFLRDTILIGLHACKTVLLSPLDALLSLLYVAAAYLLSSRTADSCSRKDNSMIDLQVLRRLFWNGSNVGIGNRLTTLEVPQDLAIIDGPTADRFNKWMAAQENEVDDEEILSPDESDDEATLVCEPSTDNNPLSRWAASRLGFSGRRRSHLFENHDIARKFLPSLAIENTAKNGAHQMVNNLVGISKSYVPPQEAIDMVSGISHTKNKFFSKFPQGRRLYNSLNTHNN